VTLDLPSRRTESRTSFDPSTALRMGFPVASFELIGSRWEERSFSRGVLGFLFTSGKSFVSVHPKGVKAHPWGVLVPVVGKVVQAPGQGARARMKRSRVNGRS